MRFNGICCFHLGHQPAPLRYTRLRRAPLLAPLYPIGSDPSLLFLLQPFPSCPAAPRSLRPPRLILPSVGEAGKRFCSGGCRRVDVGFPPAYLTDPRWCGLYHPPRDSAHDAHKTGTVLPRVYNFYGKFDKNVIVPTSSLFILETNLQSTKFL